MRTRRVRFSFAHSANMGARQMSIPRTFAAVSILGLMATGSWAHAQLAEPLPIFSASSLLANHPLTGPNYRIADAVRNDGFANNYVVTVEIGRASCRERVCQYV